MDDGRFGDPPRRFRVRYAAAQHRDAFIETLARLRPSLEILVRAAEVTGSDEQLLASTIPSAWHYKRGVGPLPVLPSQQRVDLRAPDTRWPARSELARTLLELGLSDLDLSRVMGSTSAHTRHRALGPRARLCRPGLTEPLR